MRLARRISIAISLGICLVLGVNAWLQLRQKRAEYRADLERDHTGVGRGVAAAVSFVWLRDGQEVALEVVEQLNRRESHITIGWVWRDAIPPEPHAPRSPRLIPKAGERSRSAVVSDGGAPHILTYVNVDAPGERDGAIELYESLADEERAMRTILLRAAATTTVLLTMCVALTFGFGVVFVARPLRALMDKASRIGKGDLSGALEPKAHDEVRELAVAMNEMCERLANARERVAEESRARLGAMEQLRHADRLRTVGELSSGIAHQLGTPLNVVRVRGSMICQGEVSEARMRELGSVIVENVDRMSDTIRQLLDFARREQPKMTSGDLVKILERTLDLVEPLAHQRHVALVSTMTPSSALANVDSAQVHQALTNVLVNAVQATPAGGQVRIDLREAKGSFVVEVRDTGEGISPVHLSSVLEPFFTTKRAGEGTGLGLSVADEIVRQHGGTIEVESSAQEGTLFRISLPKCA